MWRSAKHAFGVAWLGGTSSIRAEVLHRSVERTGEAVELRGGAWNGVENLWDEVEKECVSLPP